MGIDEVGVLGQLPELVAELREDGIDVGEVVCERAVLGGAWRVPREVEAWERAVFIQLIQRAVIESAASVPETTARVVTPASLELPMQKTTAAIVFTKVQQ